MKEKLNIIKVLKIAVGSGISIFLAIELGLRNSTSAGIITLLSIQDTKRETLKISIKRIFAFFIALTVAYSCFLILGYHVFSLSIFLIIFVPICHLLSFHNAISISTVLITHFLNAKSMDLFWVKNELCLLFIGTGIGILMNLYIPNKIEMIRADQLDIENDMKKILYKISALLLQDSKTDHDDIDFDRLEKKLDHALARAYENMQNTLLSDTKYYIQYIDMRKNQCHVLERVYIDLYRLNSVWRQTYIMSQFIEDIGASFHEYNNTIMLLEKLKNLKEAMKQEVLPTTRNEFENRAILYRLLFELEEFLLLKVDFVKELNEKQIAMYWSEKNTIR